MIFIVKMSYPGSWNSVVSPMSWALFHTYHTHTCLLSPPRTSRWDSYSPLRGREL